MSIIAEATDYIQVFSDGSVRRSAPEIVPACEESSGGYKSKDVIIDPRKQITRRIFLPDIQGSCTLFPVVVYFHGGGFCIGSTTWAGNHHFLGVFSVASQSIVFSVDYRLAPEHRLPIAYDDCYSSLEWLCSQANNGLSWFKQADPSRVFLSEDIAGGNIAHQVAIKAMRSKALYVKIKGLLLIHPYFGSEERTEKERADDAAGYVAMNDMFWRLSIPDWSNRDYFGCNFEKQEVSEAECREFPVVGLYVAGLDFLKERGVMYAEFLQRKEVKKVTLVETERESHVFHVFYPKSEATRLLQRQMSEFIKEN